MPRTRTLLREVSAARRLRRTLTSMAPDVVHLHSSQAGLVGRLAWARKGQFVIHTPHAYYYLGKSGIARWVFLSAEESSWLRLFPERGQSPRHRRSPPGPLAMSASPPDGWSPAPTRSRCRSGPDRASSAVRLCA